MTQEEEQLREALEMVLLFHSGGAWTAERAKRWERWTGSDDATTRAMCDQIRVTLFRAPEGAPANTDTPPVQPPKDTEPAG